MKRELKPGTMLNPLPVVMVSCGSGDEKNIITIAWTGIINSEPPMTYVSVRKSRHSHSLISASKDFVINLVTEELAEKTDYCGVKSGRDEDKFMACQLTPVKASKVDSPMIKESPVNIECRVTDIKELGSHDMFIAEIVAVHADEELFDEEGRIRLDQIGLVTYNHGEYFGIKRKPLGKFGFSVMKPKTAKRLRKEAAEKKRTSVRRPRGKAGSPNRGDFRGKRK